MDITERFLNYVAFDTQSDPASDTTPSTPKQMVFARYLKSELQQVGLRDISLDENGYLFATLPANTEADIPVIGFISHIDTSPDMTGTNVKPRIVPGYAGENIQLNPDTVLSPKQFPELLDHKGEDLIVTDGTTLLGADDKAGIAEIVSAMEYLVAHPEIKHGKIRIAFTPDEEIGMGPHKFDVKKFGCRWAYTMDGGEVGELEFENFNAAQSTVSIKGLNVHPGYAKGKMVNSIIIANEFMTMVPADQTPATTSGYEGFFHITGIKGEIELTTLKYLIRDHDQQMFETRKHFLQSCADKINKKYAKELVTVETVDQYYNMRSKVEPLMHIIDIAFCAMQEAGVEPKVKPIRGGTDGAQLSFMGLPCPNIFAGGMNMHGRFEYIPIQSMEKAMNVVIKIAALTARRYQ